MACVHHWSRNARSTSRRTSRGPLSCRDCGSAPDAPGNHHPDCSSGRGRHWRISCHTRFYGFIVRLRNESWHAYVLAIRKNPTQPTTWTSPAGGPFILPSPLPYPPPPTERPPSAAISRKSTIACDPRDHRGARGETATNRLVSSSEADDFRRSSVS